MISLKEGAQKMKHIFSLLLALFVLLGAMAVFAQETSTTGSISGSVLDSNGSVVPGAAVKITGPLGERTATTNDQGNFDVQGLVPGSYTVRVEKAGFKSGEVTNVTVLVGKSISTRIALQVGDIAETVTVIGGGEGIDQGSTETSSNLNDQLFSNIPVARGVSGLFYLAPGTTDSLGG